MPSMTNTQKFVIVFFGITSPLINSATREARVQTFAVMIVGTEWLIEAVECDADKLRNEAVLRDVFDRVVSALGLQGHRFLVAYIPGSGRRDRNGGAHRIAPNVPHLSGTSDGDLQSLLLSHSAGVGLGRGTEASALGAVEVLVTKVERGKLADPRSQVRHPRSRTAGGDS